MTSVRRPLAILLGSPLTEDVFATIGMPYLAGAFEVTIIDCGHWVRVGMDRVEYRKYDYGRVETVANEPAFERVIRRLRPKYAVDFISKGPYTRAIQNVLRRAGTDYVAQRIAPSPIPASTIRSWSALAATGRRALGWLRRGVSRANALPPDIALLAGSRANDYWTAASRRILWTGSPDYFRLKQIQETRRLGHVRPVHEGKFLLFIDDCLSLSLDYVLTGRPRPIEPTEYHPLLRRTFDRLEDALSVPVVVAAHPNGKDIEGYASLFGGRPVYFDATAPLALDAGIALTHYSTAIAYPVLLQKPIVLLNAGALRGTYQGDAIQTMVQLLKCPVMAMDAAEPAGGIIARAMTIDAAAYEHYEQSYITTVRSSDTHPFQPFVRAAAGCQLV